jgi:hypothetical protein
MVYCDGGEASAKLGACFKAMIAERRHAPGTDLVSTPRALLRCHRFDGTTWTGTPLIRGIPE